ncbi:hypothetical protein FHT32_006720 [Variovorax sp. SG517]|uniref:hypothetical protein n=1 Tax=Variovorax sp. SG517 TaxID=2587117 RepID=UPI00159D4EC7|nr:hypothetical protein [Variovorax sp. SG517]NVM93027.1 hypothetical protein [Variovorax sp. SG517]
MNRTSMIVFGSWRLRHAEPSTEAARRLRVQRVPARWGARAAQADCRGAHALVAHCVDAAWQPVSGGVAAVPSHNVDPDWVPLARVELDGGLMHIRHLVDRADRHVAHFIAPPVPEQPFAPSSLYEQLWRSFQANHLQTNNYECHYAVHAQPQDLHLILDTSAPPDVLALGDAWLDALDADQDSPFVAQIGDELQHSDHDNILCRVLPHLEGRSGWANAALFSRKRRGTVLEPLAEFSAVLRRDANAPWTHEHHPDQMHGAAVEVDLAQHFDLPLRPVARWRHTRASSGCESLETGNLFSVAFSCAQAATPILLCTIGYLRTRGHGNAALVAQDQAALHDQLLQFLGRLGLDAHPAAEGLAHVYERIAEGSPRP